MSKEAMKLALEALERMTQPVKTNDETQKYKTVTKAITALREALAEQPAQQQEPVGTYGEIFESMRSLLRSGRQVDQQIYMAMQCKPLYTSPPAQRKPLTPEWIWTWLMDWCKRNGSSPANYNSLFKMVADARAIEAAHGIKENT